MPGVIPDGSHGVRIEGLHIQECLKAALLQHFCHSGGNAAGGKGALDSVGLHVILQIPGHCQRDSAAARLIGKSIFHQTRSNDHLTGVVCDGQLHRVSGLTGSPLADKLGVADPLHLHHAVHRRLGDADGVGRIGHQMIGNGHHLFGEPGVHLCIAHGAKSRWAQAAVHIAHVIAAGGPDKGHVNPPLPPLDGAGPATVGFEHHRLGQDTLSGDSLRQLSPHTAGLNASDDTQADIVDQAGMVLAQGGSTQSQVPDTHSRNLRHDLGEHQVSVAQVVVEGNGHPVL